MEPGQVAVQLGGWVGSAFEGGVESQVLVGAEVPVSHDVGIVGWVGVHRHADGSFDPRDAVLAVAWVPIARDDFVLRVQPGLNLPLGGISSGLYFTPLSTTSVDPFLVLDSVYGSTWLVGSSLVARVPLYAGWDSIRQGPFFRVDLRGARRLGDVVPWLGVSGVNQLPSDPRGAAPDFVEIAATAGAVVNASARWSVTGQVRASLAGSEGYHRQVSGGLNVRFVVGKPSHDHTQALMLGPSAKAPER